VLVGPRSSKLSSGSDIEVFASAVLDPTITSIPTLTKKHKEFLEKISTISSLSSSLLLICNSEKTKFKVFAKKDIGRGKIVTALHGIYITATECYTENDSFSIGNNTMYHRSVKPLIQYMQVGLRFTADWFKDDESTYAYVTQSCFINSRCTFKSFACMHMLSHIYIMFIITQMCVLFNV
jgi:hypothetical protein